MTIYQLTATDGSSADADRLPWDGRGPITGTVLSSATVPTPSIPSVTGPQPVDGEDEAPDDIAGSVYADAAHGRTDLPSDARQGGLSTAAAILVAARKTGSAIAWSAGRSWTGARYIGHGVRHGVPLGIRHIRAHDHMEAVGGIKSKSDLELAKDVRKDRLWFLLGTAAAVAVGTAIGYEHLGWIVPATEGGVFVGALGAYGRSRLPQAHVPAPSAAAPAPAIGRPAPAFIVPKSASGPTSSGEIGRSSDGPAPASAVTETPSTLTVTEEDDGGPFPLSLCATAEEARECLARAFRAQGIRTSDLRVTRRYDWGWEYDVTLKGKGSTSATVNTKLSDLETDMHLPEGGFMPETDSANMAHLTIRLRIGDPFAAMPKPAVHAPQSLSVHNLIPMGWDITGEEFALYLDGFFGAIVGAMGAGKTLGALRTLAEAITACEDAVGWDLDPVKGGLAEFGDLMEVRARGPEECTAALLRVVAFIEARGRLMRDLGMGDRWKASKKHPALFVFIDEYIYLPKEAKALAIKALRLGRQYGIYLVFAGQELTEDAAGDAIGALLAWVILMACRPEDVRIALGPGQMARGWRPDRLVPSAGPITNDAGKSYIKGGAFTRPIQRRFWAYSPEQIGAAIPERLAVGVTRMDVDTRREAGEQVSADGRELTLADQVDALATQHGITDGPVIAALLRLYDAKGAEFIASSTLIEYLDDDAVTWAGQPVDGDRLGRILRAHAPGAVVSRPVIDGRQVRGWYLTDVTRAAEGLIDPSGARQQAA